MSQQAEKNNHYLLSNWKPENPAFWEKKGKPIARRNLVISVACTGLLRVDVIQRRGSQPE